MPNPFSHWPETMPYAEARDDRLRRVVRRRLWRTVISVTAFYACVALAAIAFIDWANG